MKLIRTGWFLTLVFVFLASFAMAFTGTGWLPGYSPQLGINSEDSPGASEEFSQFESVIVDPLKFKELAGVEVETEEKVTVSHAGNMRWSLDIDGSPVNPAAFRLKIERLDRVLVFIPVKGSGKLKLYERPPFRSSSVPRKPKT